MNEKTDQIADDRTKKRDPIITKDEGKPFRVLCYSPYNMWELHGLWETTILHSLRLRGAETRIVLCDGLYTECDMYWKSTNPRHSMSCNHCQAAVTNLMSRMQTPYEWLGRHVHSKDFVEARLWAESLLPENYQTAEYQTWEVGRWVRGSIQSHFRVSELDIMIPEVRDTYKNYLYSGLVACFGLNRLLNECRPHVLFLFNGRMSSPRIAFELARRKGIRVISHERGWLTESLRLSENATCLDLPSVKQVWNDWGNIPLCDKELELAHNCLMEREHGKGQSWHSFSPPPQDITYIYQQLGLSGKRPIWGLFTSSDDEVVSAEGWEGIFPRQHEWVAKTVAYVKNHPEIDLVIRIHPNTGGKKSTGKNQKQLVEFQQLGRSLPDNVHMVMPDDPISTYSLMEICTVGLVYQSTVALEMACKGKIVVIATKSFFSDMPFARTVKSVSEYENILDQARVIPSLNSSYEIKRLAYRYAYGLFFRHNIPFPLVKMPDPHHGHLAYTSTNSLLPGKEPNLDRIARIILDGEPVCPPPTFVDKARSEQEEIGWFANKIEAGLNDHQDSSIKDHTSENTVETNDPLVSIIIPCYKYARYLSDAVKSVIKQTYPNIEIIIVNDGSPDNTEEIAEALISKYSAYNIRLLNQENSGQPAISRNNGIASSRGNYILCLDADDLIAPTMISECMHVLKSDWSVSIAYTDRQDFDGCDQIVPAGDYDFAALKYANQISYCALYKKEIWNAIHGYRTNVKGVEDWDFWIAAGARGYIGKRIPKPLLWYRRHDTGVYQEAINNFEEKFAQIILNNREVYSDDDVNKALRILSSKKTGSSMNCPLVTVVIPTFNRPDMLKDAINSVRRQTVQDIEIIVVNDGGEDISELASSFNDNRIKFITHPTNKGLAAARNTGIRNASAQYIALLDDDDLYYPDHLETAILQLNEGQKIVYTDAVRATYEKNGVGYELVKKHIPYSIDFDRNKLLLGNIAPVNCFVFQKALALQTGLFDETLTTLEDWDFWIRLSAHTPMKHISKPTVQVNWRTDGTTMTTSRQSEFKKNRESIYIKNRAEIDKIPNINEIMAEFQAIWSSDPAQNAGHAQTRSENIKGLTSIIILTYNQLEYTKKCVKSIEKQTPEPHEIVFVDNGSTDGTVKWLKAQVRANNNYKLIENKENLGFAKGCNQGIEAASGEYILLLNNDVVVTEGWLSGMLECLKTSPNIGIVGPMTNNISGLQQVPNANYTSINLMHDYSKSFKEKYRHRRILSSRIVGFCMLFRRSLVDKIGLLDDSFGTGNFEDDDFCLRSALAGYENYIAGDVFIHHYGSRSFIGNSIDYGSSILGNRQIFDAKWTGVYLNTTLGKRLAVHNAKVKAESMNQKGKRDQAITALVEGLKQVPDEKTLYYRIAELMLEAGLYKEALRTINNPLVAAAENDLRYFEILACAKAGLGEHVEEYINRMLEIDNTYAPALDLKALDVYKQGKHEVVEHFLRQAIEADPGYGKPYTNLGSLKWESGRKDEALDYLRKGFILSPTLVDCLNAYHSAITELQQFVEAEEIVRDTKVLYPDSRNITFLFIDILIKQNKYDKAMEEIERVMVEFGIDDGMLAAALEIRNKVGIKEINKAVNNKGTLSLCMIVKNEEQHIARCLLSAKPVVDEMIIVDTGSTDKTRDIALAYGAKVFDFPWTKDFSAARNQSLANASGEWILVLDADEVISPLDHAALRKLITKNTIKPIAYSMTTRNYTNEVSVKGWTANDHRYPKEEAGTGWFPSTKVRLFPNSKGIQFENPVHEFVESTVEKAGMTIKTLGIPIHHYGRFDKDKLITKGKEYFLLGKQKIDEMGKNPKALTELAVQASELGEYETAVELWKKVIELNGNNPVAFLNISYAYMKLEKYEEALASSRRAMELDPEMKEAPLNYAGAELVIGDINKTISALETLLQKNNDYPPAMALLGAAYYLNGRDEEGFEIFEKLRKKGFNCAEFFIEQYQSVISQGKIDQAIVLLEASIRTGNTNQDTHRLLAECQNKKRDVGIM